MGPTRPHAPGAVIRPLAERPARRPQAAQLLFVQTKSNQKIAKTGGFGFLMCLICFAPEARSGVSKLVLAAYGDFCVCLGVFSGEYQYLEEQTAVPL